MTVSDVSVTALGSVAGDIVVSPDYYVGASFINNGQLPIKTFSVTLGLIIPGPDGH
jgi:hypothetical protein